VVAYLKAAGQVWREDSSNRQLSFTRNRIRHELLPEMEKWNPQLRIHLANMATLARDEEAWWTAEIDRLAPQLILPGRPVRGGGRAWTGDVALDCTRLAALATAMQRRLLRRAAAELGAAPDFAATEALLELALHGRAGQRLELAGGVVAERTPRELRLGAWAGSKSRAAQSAQAIAEYRVGVPGQVDAPFFGVSLKIGVPGAGDDGAPAHSATLRNWRPGDRVRLRYSSGPRKVKEVLEYMRVTGSDRAIWPVLELEGRLIWMQGAELEPEQGLTVTVTPLEPRVQKAGE